MLHIPKKIESRYKLLSKGVEELDKKKALIQVQTEIDFSKNKIAELNEEGKNTDKVFYQGMLQAYENMKIWLKNKD